MSDELRVSELGNNKVMKQLLDEQFSLKLEKKNIKPDVMISNYPLFIMMICSVFALLSHYNGYTWPDSRPIAFACSIAYFITYLIGELISHYIYKDVFFAGQPPESSRYKKIGKIYLTSVCDRYDEEYVLQIYTFDGQKKIAYSKSYKLGHFFQEDGLLLVDTVSNDLDTAYDAFIDLYNENTKQD